jgi:hypothetical protein
VVLLVVIAIIGVLIAQAAVSGGTGQRQLRLLRWANACGEFRGRP